MSDICILGASRTGTTLLAESLGTHPSVVVPGEIFEGSNVEDWHVALDTAQSMSAECRVIKLLFHQPHPSKVGDFGTILTELISRNFTFIMMVRDYLDREMSHLIATKEQNWQDAPYQSRLSVPEDFHGHLYYVSNRNKNAVERMAVAPPYVLNYEDMLNMWPTVMWNVQRLAGLDPLPLEHATKRQRTAGGWGTYYNNYGWAQSEYEELKPNLFFPATHPELFEAPKK